jgi:hypothetical protein
MTSSYGVSCQVCNKQKAPGEISPRQSRLLPSVKDLLICKKCDSEGKEPRAFVIIVAHTKGFDAVKTYIKYHKYEGSLISAKELIR